MSQSDSFIEEVTEEVRRDRLVALARRYGWIAALVVLALIGAVAFSEWRSAQAMRAAQDTGDAVLAALSQDASADRAAALSAIDQAGQAEVVVSFLRASALAEAGEVAEAATALDAIAGNGDLPLIYRQIARFKSLTVQSTTLDAEARRAGFAELAVPGNPLRLLAEEQLALIEAETGDTDAAITRLNAMLIDAEVTPDLQQRALQVIVALGGEPNLEALGLPAAN
ncbi:MAG: hypothetical protein AAGM84_01990 [Pseudomonadota bacterium]